MKILASAIAICTLSVGIVAAQDPQTARPQQEKTLPDVTLTGCLVQGSGPTVFIFDRARKDPKDVKEVAGKYVVVVAAEDVDLRTHLNHEIRITGTTDGRPVLPVTQKAEEKDLPKLSAKSVTMVAETCSAPVR